MRKTAFLTDEIYLKHNTGMMHPERSGRISAIHDKIKAAPYYKDLVLLKPVKADFETIELVHSSEYIMRVKKEIESGVTYLDSPDTPVCRESFDVALYAVGGGLVMCDAVFSGAAVNGFCSIRPPGHHAERDHAAGFCIFNNIAIAARYLQTKHKINRIAIVDWDVHHGNGTQHSFENDNTIFFISLHQFPHYPGTGSSSEKGKGKGSGYTMNIPMRSGSEDEDYISAFNKSIIPALDAFKPEIILISAGFDAHDNDDLSSISLSSEVYYRFTHMLMDVASKHSFNRVIAFLEGGYDLVGLADSVDRVITAFREV